MAIRDYLALGISNILGKIGLGQSASSDPYADPTIKSGQNEQPMQKGKVFQRWTYPFRGYSMPILEMPSNRVQRYLLAFEYFTTDSLCNASTRIKTEFALAGLDFDVIIEEDEWPEWVPEDWRKEYNDMVKSEAEKESDKLPMVQPPMPVVMPATADDLLPMGVRTPSPTQDQPQITDVGKKTDPKQWQPGQDVSSSMPPTPPTEITPIRQFVANKMKLDLMNLTEKLDLQQWIIRFGQEAMIYGDGFSNIVEGLEVGDDKPDMVVQKIIKYNNLMDEIRKTYSQSYNNAFSKLSVGKNNLINSFMGALRINLGSASMEVGPELLEQRNQTAHDEWEMAEGDTLYKKFMSTARERDSLVKGDKYTIAEIQTLNPSAVWVTRNDVGEVIKIELVKRIGLDSSPLNIDDIIHWKWQGPDWMTYGISEFFPAFRHIRLKRSLEEALAANAERYANPIIQMQVGTDKVSRLQIPSQSMLDDANDLVSSYDRRSILVTPYHYNLQIHGMEGKPLRLEKPLEYAVEQQISVLGIPKAFLWGDGTNFASVRAQFQTMIFRLRLMQKEAARILVSRIYNRYLKKRGYLTVKGKIPTIKIKWAQQELDSEQSVIGLINAFANLAKSVGSTELPLSYTTILGSLGHDFEQETYRKAREKALMKKMADGVREQPPAQQAFKEPPSAMQTRLRQAGLASLAEDLNNLSWTRPNANGNNRRRNPK